jgi:hypothetical protein
MMIVANFEYEYPLNFDQGLKTQVTTKFPNIILL